MYQSPASFHAPLSPRDYFAEDAHAQELRCSFETTWQLVGLASSVARPGQFLSAQIGRIPIVVRNFDGQLVALKNVCTHRHCSLVSARSGHNEKLKCPYHGWEFGFDGRTRRIPAAKNFPDFDRDRFRLQSYPIDQCGDLLFVRVASDGPSLNEWLGNLSGRVAKWTSAPEWKPSTSRMLPLPANWKIPVEASLESYHIPEVHPKSFAEDPGEGNSEHAFQKYSTSFYTDFSTQRFIDRLMRFYETVVLRVLGVDRDGRYEHHHVFPNLLISHTDTLTLVQSIHPVSSTSSVTEVWQFGRQSSRRDPVSRLTGVLWGKLMAWLSLQVLKEDIQIFSHVQRGQSAAAQHAILGRCEERLYAFQTFVAERSRAADCCPVEDEKTDCSASPSCENSAVANTEAQL